MASSWFANSGINNLYSQKEPETLEEKQKRLEQANNRLPGNAGFGSVFTQTNGGVQRTYNPISVTRANENQVNRGSNVQTGRSVAATEAEQGALTTLGGLQNRLSGTNVQGGSLLNRLGAVQGKQNLILSDIYNKKENIFGDLDTRADKNTLKSMVEASSFDPTFLFKAALENAKKVEVDKTNEILNNLYGDVPNVVSNLEKEVDLRNSLGLTPNIDLSTATAKERAGYQAGLKRLRDAGIAPTLNEVNSNLTTIGDLASSLEDSGKSKVKSSLEGLYGDFENKVNTQRKDLFDTTTNVTSFLKELLPEYLDNSTGVGRYGARLIGGVPELLDASLSGQDNLSKRQNYLNSKVNIMSTLQGILDRDKSDTSDPNQGSDAQKYRNEAINLMLQRFYDRYGK